MNGDARCIDGRLMRHDPQHDDPDLETELGACPECDGKGRNCEDCGAAHAEETWDIPIPPGAEYFCEACADRRRDRWMENHG
ncbi:MAG TPA: hypothetical protein VH020_09355 [Stellaceae bacterium]|nr:hypothetical protein [Stellaceae bacterium]